MMDETYVLLGLVSSRVQSVDLKKTILHTVGNVRTGRVDGYKQLLNASSLCISALSHISRDTDDVESILSDVVRHLLGILRLLPNASLPGLCDFHHALPPGESISFTVVATLSEIAWFHPQLRQQIVTGLISYIESLVSALGPLLASPSTSANDENFANNILLLITSTLPQFFGFCRAFGRVQLCTDKKSSPLLRYLSEPVQSTVKHKSSYRLYDDIGSTLASCGVNQKNISNEIVPLQLGDLCRVLKPLCKLLSIVPVFSVSEHLSDMIATKRVSRRRYIYSTSVVESFRLNILAAIKELLPALTVTSETTSSGDSAESLKSLTTAITTLANEILDVQQQGNASTIARSPQARTLHVAASAACVSILSGLASNLNEADTMVRRLSGQLMSRDAAVTTASVISHRELYSVCLNAIPELASRFSGVVDAASLVLQQFITEPAPLLLRLARHVAGAQSTDGVGTSRSANDTLTPVPNVSVNDYAGTNLVAGTAGEVLHGLRQIAIKGLVRCQSLSVSDSDSISNSILRALPKRLYVVESYKSGVARDFVSQSILLAVGHLATAPDAPPWSHDFALNVLQQRLARPPSPILDVLIVRQLGQIYAHSSTKPESAATIMDIFSRILMAAYQPTGESSGSTQFRHLVSDTVTTLAHVAEKLRNQELSGGSRRLADLLLRLLRSFVSLGLEAKRKRDQGTVVSTSSIAVGLGQLLPAISQACDALPVLTEQQKLFRDVWLFIITSGLAIDAPQPLWFPQWAESVRILAAKSPFLVCPQDAAMTRSLLSTCALGEDAATPAELSEYRQSLVSLSMPAPSSPAPQANGTVATVGANTGGQGQPAVPVAKGNTVASGTAAAAVNPSAADTAAMVSRLSFAHCTYLLSVYKIEKYRAELRTSTGDSGLSPAGIDGMFIYLEDRVLQREKSGVYPVLCAIADSVFSSLLLAIADQPRESARELLLDRLSQLLLVKFNHQHRTIRRMADSFLTRLVARFSHVLWSRTVLATVLDILQLLSDALNSEPAGQTVDLIVSNTPGYTIQLPDNPAARESLLTDFGLRAADIFREAMRWAPSTTRSHAIHYLLRSGEMGMAGLAPTAQGVLRFVGIGHGGAVTSLNANPNPSLSLWQQLMNRCQYAAKLAGFKSGFSVNDNKAGTLYQIYIDSLRVQPASAATGSISSKQRLLAGADQTCQDLLFSATALLVSSEEFERSAIQPDYMIGRDRALLAAICRHAVTHHRVDCAAAAVACFDWLLSARPDLSGRLVSSLSAAFQVACVLRQGLFSIDPSPSLDVFLEDSVKKKSPEGASDDPVLPHVIILRFLTEKAVLAQYAESMDAEILCALAMRCLRPCLMSQSFSALSAKALLALVALNLLQSEALVPGGALHSRARSSPGSSVIRTALRDRVYATLLDHFASPLQSMLAIDERADLRPLLTDLIRLWSTVNNEKKYFPLPARPGTANTPIPNVVVNGAGTTSPIPSSASVGASSFVNTGNIVRHDAEVSQQRTNPYYHRSAAASTFSGSSNRRHRLGVTTEMNAEAGYVRSWRSKRTLLLLLLAHEIERLQVWYNPTGAANRNVAGWDQIRAFREIIPQTKDKVWRDIVKHAWTVSPAVALSLVRRFPLDVIKAEISRIITADPLGAVHLPTALTSLASIKNLEADSKQLTFVLHWAQTNPITALAYFSRLYPPHPLTHQYAARVLKTSTPSALLPYIPQMVQALRHDPMGYMASVLVWLASHSQLLTHQLIWNMRTNTFRDDSGQQRDGVLGPIVDSLEIAIKNQLTGSGNEFFKREFDFFAELTDVSAEIRPYPKGPQRKQACQEAIRKVQLPSDGAVYLPSNPESLVVGIDYTSATPMQSAAKAPYLARFSILPCGLDAVERIGAGESPFPKNIEPKTQGAIFKVGDDVRQDILALQIIRGLQSSFYSAGLSSVASGLAPYMVVATAPGCGVIECVPDSKSIDQIGKQTDTSLYEYFLAQYGGEEQAPGFQKIRGNFIRSMAAYSLICYILQIKDRHNGNLMIDGSGRIVHIDFGFLFESSPGGNLGFEPDFKLSRELLIVMAGAMPVQSAAATAASTSGGSGAGGQTLPGGGAANTWPETSPGFQHFIDLCIRAFLVARQLDEPIITLVSLMLDTGLPCFRGRTIEQLRTRLGRQLSERQAADHMLAVIRYCCQNWRSGAYDWLQYQQNEIQYH